MGRIVSALGHTSFQLKARVLVKSGQCSAPMTMKFAAVAGGWKEGIRVQQVDNLQKKRAVQAGNEVVAR